MDLMRDFSDRYADDLLNLPVLVACARVFSVTFSRACVCTCVPTCSHQAKYRKHMDVDTEDLDGKGSRSDNDEPTAHQQARDNPDSPTRKRARASPAGGAARKDDDGGGGVGGAGGSGYGGGGDATCTAAVVQ